MRREIGEFSRIPLVTIEYGEEIPTDSCPACGDSGCLTAVKFRSQSVDYLEPVLGEPYPTYAVYEMSGTDFRCLRCGCRWGKHEMHDERIPTENICCDREIRLPINDPSFW